MPSTRGATSKGAGDEGSGSSGSKVTKRPNRRDPDARREQNRIASRNYRQKRKEKLALLDQLTEDIQPSPTTSGSVGPRSANPPTAAAAEEAFEATEGFFRSHQRDLIIDFVAGQAATAVDSRVLSESVTNHGWNQDDLTDMAPPPPPPPLSNARHAALDSSYHPRRPEPPHGQVWDVSDTDNNGATPARDQISQPATIVTSSSTMYEEDEDDAAVLNILKSVRSLSSNQRRQLLRRIRHQTAIYADGEPDYQLEPQRRSYDHPTSLSSSSSSPFSSTSSVTRNRWLSTTSRSGPPRNRLHYEARRFASFVERHVTGHLAPTQLSRIYVVEAGFFGAIFANCYALGMNDTDALTTEEGGSPFTVDQDTGHDPSLLPVLRSRFSNITPDLLPCDTQMTVGHHPYLDVLPFKVFRDNAIKALDEGEGGLDEDALCADLMGGGLVCWGAQQDSLGMEAGVPWDARSWEPRVWFLQKYSHLVGNWDDQMWRCTRWWHQARGERLKF